MDELSKFRQFLISELAKRAVRANEFMKMFGAPANFYDVAFGRREPTEDDFNDIANYLDVSVDYIISLYVEDDALLPDNVIAGLM